MKEEIKKIDKKRNEELYIIKKKEKEEKEKQVRDLEHKERQHMQLLQNVQQQQAEINCRYQDMERQKELQLSKVTEDHNRRMEAEIQRIVEGNNEEYNNMMKALEGKLQEQLEQHTLMMQEIMRENDFLKQQAENRQQIELEKDRANETLMMPLDEQEISLNATRDILLQEHIKGEQFYEQKLRQHKRTLEQKKNLKRQAIVTV